MADAIYFAGGFYHSHYEWGPLGKRVDIREFGMVSPSGKGKPYLTKNPKGLRLTSHHANLYRLSEDGKRATMVDNRCGGVGLGRHTVALTEEQQRLIQESIRTNYFFD